MCTSFAFCTEKSHLVGMNFDNDGKELRIASFTGKDISFMVGVNETFFPSFGISASGIFVNDLMVDDLGKGKYARQNEKRWVSTKLVQTILEGRVSADDLSNLFTTVEIVNNPGGCTQNLIVSPDGRSWVIEHGISNSEYNLEQQKTITMTNFPLSQYQGKKPDELTGSGADRFTTVSKALTKIESLITVDDAFGILSQAKQSGSKWKTQLSLVYDIELRAVYISTEGSLASSLEFRLETGKLKTKMGEEYFLTKSGISLHDRKINSHLTSSST